MLFTLGYLLRLGYLPNPFLQRVYFISLFILIIINVRLWELIWGTNEKFFRILSNVNENDLIFSSPFWDLVPNKNLIKSN